MANAHDQQSGKLDLPSEIGPAARPAGIDPLSDVLRTVRLTGALFFLVDASSPWCVDVPDARKFADIILPQARHVVSYHIAVEGRGLVGIPGSDPVEFCAGDIIVFPHADPYLMASAQNVEPDLNFDETLQFFRDLANGQLPFVIPEGGGREPKAKFICGYLGCDLNPFNPLFGALPRLLHIRHPGGTHADLLDRLVELAIAEARTDRVGGQSIRLGLSELMFVEVLRRHLETMSSNRPNWLTGLRDPVIGRALALLHANPAADWTLDTLARETGASRSVFTERFSSCVGETPMRYLSLWRMQLAARMLTDGGEKVAEIAQQIGFGSEAAFSRAFKRETGLSPAKWRNASLHTDQV